MEDEALHRFDEVWNLMIAAGGIAKRGMEFHLRIATGDAHVMKQAVVSLVMLLICQQKDGLHHFLWWRARCRSAAWSEVRNTKNNYGAEVPHGHTSQYLSAVCNESVALFDLMASFFNVDLPRVIRACFRCHTESGELVELDRLPMGYEGSTEIVHTITRALAGDADVVRTEHAAPNHLRIHT
ncbi:unnamed protein product [Trypanosoma congolense IL3000]|uniref:WGS project CAEQ00000000 data, annotated contig 280 n=1 Tax=Trypanosoma congolense (strain IL3000) TaxID=1068625 RepID=F9WEK2_TRYCI|nr:unnamed protein product [Trypanosoma congolense IL3000]